MLRNIGKVMVVALSIAAIWLIAVPAVHADDWDKATRITVNHPFEIPGKILPAGTYIVKIVDLAGERHVVRFLSEDQKTIYATLIGIPDYRLEPTDNTAITFYEPEVNRAPALHDWFYPGHQFGIEFAYPKKQAVAIANATEVPVIAFNVPEPTPVTPEELLEAPLVEVIPAEEVARPEVAPEPPYVPEPQVDYEIPAELPRTATPFPLLGLIGLITAGAASAIRLRK